jgi:ribosome maturation factor RimP
MALQIDQIRAIADRVAASHHLEVVDLEFSGGAKHRTLRVFIEKDPEARAKLVELAKAAEAGAPLDPLEHIPDLPSGVPAELLSGVTHDDCTVFTHDFGTLLDVEDLVPGAEYTLEVSSPGLERKLSRPQDFTRFTGTLITLQTFTAVAAEPGKTGNRHFQGRLTNFENGVLTLNLAAIKQKGPARKSATAQQIVEIPFSNVEKANLIPEI